MMNHKTRRLSKMPEEVRDELTPWFIEKKAINEEAPEKIVKLDKEAKYMNSDLKVCHHFNHGRVTIFNVTKNTVKCS
jgi:hypothetical protein